MREESLVTSIMKRNVAGGISTVCYVPTRNTFRNLKEGATVCNGEL